MRLSRNTLRASALVAACVALVSNVPAGADTLVTKSGAQVQTRGPWKVKGNLVVFTGADGKLASLRTSEVDLERSATATAAAPTAPAEPAKPAKSVVLRLTDNDVGHVDEAAPAAGATGETEKSEAAAPAPGKTVVVLGWDQHPAESGDGIYISGSIQNSGKNTATGITLDIGLYDAEGKLIQVTRAALASENLPAGQKTTFRCNFPGVASMTAAKFDVRSNELVNVPPTTDSNTPPAAGSPPPPR